jgi:hypothetical protein
MFGSLVRGDGARLDRDVGGDGAGFLGYLFGGIDIGDRVPTRSAYNDREYLLIGRSC